MLFNSFVFLLIFLPLVLLLFYSTRKWASARLSIAVLVLASFIFYGYWNPVYLLLLLASIGLNYAIGHQLYHRPSARLLLFTGVSLNLLLLGYFKYTNFLIENANNFLGLSIQAQEIILPLAISFFTFQQIAYLVDCHRKIAEERDFLSYCLFVSFFPQLIAGPIVHHKEMMPQFSRMASLPNWQANMGAGATLFIIGLFKKVVLADNFAPYSSFFFDNPVAGAINMGDAWIASLAYSFQIYFDFSGYSDMAIGLGYMFGIVLPINFNSPYRSLSIIDFWRRWHMTLSRFLRDYLYFSLGGNRKGSHRRRINLLLTMLLGGLWHGASWNFVMWGGLHGFYLVLNHAWRSLFQKLGLQALTSNKLYMASSFLLTTLAVLIAWVYFRAPDMDIANRTIIAMFGMGESGFSKSYGSHVTLNGFNAFYKLLTDQSLSYKILMPIVFSLSFLFIVVMPNTAQLFKLIDEQGLFEWKPGWLWAAGCGFLLCCSLIGLFGASEFIYFQF